MDWIGDIQNLYRHIILEFSEGAIRKIVQKFSNDASEDEIRREVQDFEKYKGGLQKKDPFQYKSWIEFTEAIHAARGKAEFKKKKIPDESQISSVDDIIADDENVTIYKGDSQDKCVMYGRGYTFCISRPAGGNMFSNYRLKQESTFYFIYFKKKPKTEKDHIMVLDVNKNGYQWTFADNRTQTVEGGWRGWENIVKKYPELDKYQDLLKHDTLGSDERVFMGDLAVFQQRPTIDTFNNFSYKEKATALKVVTDLPDKIWEILDSTLRNEFLSVGPNLTNKQAGDLKSNEIERYKKNRNQSFEQLYNSSRLIVNDHDDEKNIKKFPLLSFQYAKLNKWQVSDDILTKAIRGNTVNMFLYLKDITNDGRNIIFPNKIVYNEIKKYPELAFRYAYDFFYTDYSKIPIDIIDSISKDSDMSWAFASYISEWKNVPKSILKSIKNSNRADEIPNNATIQESKSFVDFYYSMNS